MGEWWGAVRQGWPIGDRHLQSTTRHQGEVTSATVREDGRRCLTLSDGNEILVDQVLLATGFAKDRPGGELIDSLVESGLPVSEFDGYPVVDAALRWHPRIHVSGALAELALGPSARNIAGARLAAERICGGGAS